MLSTEEMEKLKKEAPAPYEPEKLPLNIHQMLMDSPELLAKMSKADSILGEYNGFLKNLSNPTLLQCRKLFFLQSWRALMQR